MFGARDRCDETPARFRTVRDARWRYIRNYMPDQSWNAPEWYSDQAELRQEITRVAATGKLNEVVL